MCRVISFIALMIVSVVAKADTVSDIISSKPVTFKGQMNRSSCQSHILAFALIYSGFRNKYLSAYRYDKEKLSIAMANEISFLEASLRRKIEEIMQGEDSTRKDWEVAVDWVTSGQYRLRGGFTVYDSPWSGRSYNWLSSYLENTFKSNGCDSMDLVSCLIDFDLGKKRPPLVIISIRSITQNGMSYNFGGHVIGIVNARKGAQNSDLPEILTINTSVHDGSRTCQKQWHGTMSWVKDFTAKNFNSGGNGYVVNWVEKVER